MQKTKAEIIEETVRYYEEDPSRRSYDMATHMCNYLSPTGQMCAVGRCMTDPGSVTATSDVYSLADSSESGLDGLLKEEYRGHSVDFWDSLQQYHDCALISNNKRKQLACLWTDYCGDTPMPNFTFHGENLD